MTTWLNVLNWTNFEWHLRALFLSFHMLCQISDIRLVTSLCVWVQGLKMLKEFVYPWTQPWSFSQKCSCFIHIRPFCLICAKTQTLVSLSIMVANIALPCVFSNSLYITQLFLSEREDLQAVRCQVCRYCKIFMCSLKNVLWPLSWAVVCWGRSLLTCYNVLFLRDWENVMLFALPFPKKLAGFNHSTWDELDRRRGDPSSGQISFSATSNTHSTRTCRIHFILWRIHLPEL